MVVKIITASGTGALEKRINEFLLENRISDCDIKLTTHNGEGSSVRYTALIQYRPS